jgi:uncharacterized protein YjbI with pentapeptide repeats
MQCALNRCTVLQITTAILSFAAFAANARADIFQWEYINPADPSQGKRQSTTLAPDGAGVDAVPSASLGARDLTMAYLIGADLMNANGDQTNLTNADLSQANLMNADFTGATLTDTAFTGAEIRGARLHKYCVFSTCIGTGMTLAQLYSTASYQARDLSGVGLINNILAGADFAGQNLQNASFELATLSRANFRDANLTDASFRGAVLMGANFAGQNVVNADFYHATLTGANLTDANLRNSSFWAAKLTDANFTDADVHGANFDIGGSCGPFGCDPTGTGITLTQLYSTATYQAHDLSGINLARNNLAGGNFPLQNLTKAYFAGSNLPGANFQGANLSDTDFTGANVTSANLRGASLANANFAIYSHPGNGFVRAITAALTDADLTAADARGSDLYTLLQHHPGSPNYVLVGDGALATNLIRNDGHIDGLDLEGTGLLLVRDYDGNAILGNGPIPITVDDHLTIGPGGTLRMVFESDAWDSTVSFAPGIPVMLGGTLELTFAEDVNLAGQLGRTFDLFNWTGVTPTVAFAVSSPYSWDLSNLYTTGEVTLTAIPEPSTLLLICLGLCALVPRRHSQRRLQWIAAMFVLVAFAGAARADIFQWEYINPADPSQGKRQGTTLAPDGGGISAVPGADFSQRNLTMAHLFGADLMNVNASGTNLTDADLSESDLSNARFGGAFLTRADFSHANLTHAYFSKTSFSCYPDACVIITELLQFALSRSNTE